MKPFTCGHIEMLSYPLLNRYDNIFHFVTTRHGGVSRGKYESLNLGLYAGDDPLEADKNRRLLCRAIGLPPSRLLLPRQVHGVKMAVIDEVFEQLSEEERIACLDGVDGLVTARPGYCIGITTADCVPLLLYDPEKEVVAAVHAGWRGTAGLIGPHCIRTMMSVYGCRPASVRVAIGPSVCSRNFEVGEEVADAFLNAGFPLDRIGWRHPETGRFHADLQEANRYSLIATGVRAENIETASLCTYERSDLFFSARRDGFGSGRFLSAVLLR